MDLAAGTFSQVFRAWPKTCPHSVFGRVRFGPFQTVPRHGRGARSDEIASDMDAHNGGHLTTRGKSAGTKQKYDSASRQVGSHISFHPQLDERSTLSVWKGSPKELEGQTDIGEEKPDSET